MRCAAVRRGLQARHRPQPGLQTACQRAQARRRRVRMKTYVGSVSCEARRDAMAIIIARWRRCRPKCAPPLAPCCESEAAVARWGGPKSVIGRRSSAIASAAYFGRVAFLDAEAHASAMCRALAKSKKAARRRLPQAMSRRGESVRGFIKQQRGMA